MKLNENEFRQMIQDIIRELLDEEELDEATTTGDVAGYQTPGAFVGTKPKDKKRKKDWLDKVNKIYGYEQIGDEEDATEMGDEKKKLSNLLWKNKVAENLANAAMAGKLDEGRRGKYHEYRDNEEKNPKQKIGSSLREVRDKLAEIEKVIDMNLRLKQETGTDAGQYWKRTHRALNRISEKMHRIINKIRQF